MFEFLNDSLIKTSIKRIQFCGVDVIRFKSSGSKNSGAEPRRPEDLPPTALRSIWSSWFTGVKNVISRNEIFTTFIFSDSDTNKLSLTCENNRHIVTRYGCGVVGVVGVGVGVITAAAGSDG